MMMSLLYRLSAGINTDSTSTRVYTEDSWQTQLGQCIKIQLGQLIKTAGTRQLVKTQLLQLAYNTATSTAGIH